MERIDNLISAIIGQDNGVIRELIDELIIDIESDTNADYKDDYDLLYESITFKPKQLPNHQLIIFSNPDINKTTIHHYHNIRLIMVANISQDVMDNLKNNIIYS